MPSRGRPQSSSQALAMDTTNIVLTTLRDAARIAPIPYLQGAAGAALGILDIIQGAHDNKEAFQRLADDACGLVYAAILCTNRIGTTGVSEDVLDSLRELQGTLHAVECFAKKKVSRRKIFKLIAYKSDLGAIQEHRDRMRQSLDLFALKSSITIQGSITHIAVQQEELVNALRQRAIQRDGTERNGEMILRARTGPRELGRVEEINERTLSTVGHRRSIVRPTTNLQPDVDTMARTIELTLRFSGDFEVGD